MKYACQVIITLVKIDPKTLKTLACLIFKLIMHEINGSLLKSNIYSEYTQVIQAVSETNDINRYR